ncbi:exo-alpha-sialidase [Sphingobacterium sp. SGG-5]|uniref:sialidase family protein n=1 Tax=Sphingobacterium sp. SGG-5 TaxID=2710881 RepID=UPI0013EA2A6D|nr:sialidase family protein [Sphingobacterium sp. SGG-5]NGM61345.1 exo-alpha-sialidase [Sphingobacterium sp. SGG-5]
MMKKINVFKFLIIICCTFFLNTAFSQRFNPFPESVGTVVFESEEDPIVKKVASPSIVILSNGDYLVSHDFDRGTSVHVSKDRGKTWNLLSRVAPLIWANIFEHNGDVYLMGTSKGWGNIVIYRSTNQGKTWSEPKDEFTGILAKGMFHTGPVPIVKHKGKIWRAYEEAFDAKNRRDFHAFAICADEDADLLQASSWKRTTSIRFDEKWINAKRPNWLEGNLVVTPEGKLVDFIRLETWAGKGVNYTIEGAAKGKPRNEIAGLIDVDEEHMKMIFKNEKRNFVHFPGAETKFTIRYDSLSKQYWTITNKISSFRNTNGRTHDGNWHQRNVLVLMSSSDLMNWTIKKKILKWGEGMHLRTWDTFGFQYVDWVFDSNDIAFVSRTSWYGFRYHDANMITFHRISDFRKSNTNMEPEDLRKYTKHPVLVAIPQANLKKDRSKIGDFDIVTRLGKGLVQNARGELKFATKDKPAKNEKQALALGRYFDVEIRNSKMKNFSVEALTYTPVTNSGNMKIKWTYSTNGLLFDPITRYLLNVENRVTDTSPEEERTLYLQVYRPLNSVSAQEGIVLRCYIVGGSEEDVMFNFMDQIVIGGRKL